MRIIFTLLTVLSIVSAEYALAEAEQGSGPDIVKVTGQSGITAWLIEDPSLPLVSTHIIFKHAGSAYDPADRMGTAYVFSDILNEGGSELDALAYKKILEEHAIYLGSSVNKDNLIITLNTLSEHTDKAFEMLLKPFQAHGWIQKR